MKCPFLSHDARCDCVHCTGECDCIDDFDADELGIDPEEEYDA